MRSARSAPTTRHSATPASRSHRCSRRPAAAIRFLVVVNHFKSKGSAGPWPGDVDTGDGQGASNESRVRQATALRDWVPTIQGEAESVALVGDFNSYTLEDPLQVLYDAGMRMPQPPSHRGSIPTRSRGCRAPSTTCCSTGRPERG